jgi:two-component system, NarL family, nitrate/nitrite response regulator NarL
MQEIRIVIADDHPIFRDGLNRLLHSEPDFRVVGEAGDGATAVRVCAQVMPDVLLLDVSMPGTGGLETLQRLAAEVPSVRTLVLTVGLDRAALVTALQLGARGVLLKDATTALLFQSIRSVRKEEYWLDPQTVGHLVDSLRRPTPDAPEVKPRTPGRYNLTPREMEIVMRVASGESNKDIAQALSLRENTVKHHLSSIFDKLGVFSRLELAVFALNHQLTES